MANRLQIVKEMFRKLVELQRFDSVLSKVSITAAEEGKVVAELTVSEEHANRRGALHGGYISTLVDQLSTLALITKKDLENGVFAQPGVSLELNCTFLRAAMIGETIEVTAYSLKRGKTIAFLNVDLKSKSDGKLIAKGSHTKYL